MDDSHLTILAQLFAAVLAGALIGLERTYHGRPAGFRTHVLVCTASSLLMLLSTATAVTFSGLPIESVRVDPARMAQGIMTGIGFLGAGTIMKEGISVRGLTTAASIWITASIGIMLGAGFYFAATVATALTLATLSLFRWLESAVPTLAFARLVVRFARDNALEEDALRQMIERHQIKTADMSYRQIDGGRYREYEMSLRARNTRHFRRLSESLGALPVVVEFSLTPAAEK